MFIDARHLPMDSVIRADICVIGAGAAGLSFALEFLRTPYRLAVLESGGLSFDPRVQALSTGDSVGLPYAPLDEVRIRYLGGSTNFEGWGGWCKPFDPFDFERRPSVPHSGWPMSVADLRAYYVRAHRLLALGPFDYDARHWEECTGGSPLGLLSLGGTRIETEISQISPVRFGDEYRTDFRHSANVCVYLHATATELVTEVSGAISGVHARTLAGNRARFVARAYVLATGGIENARLLLVSNRHRQQGLGNGHDLVGRFFMDNPRFRIGDIVFADRRTVADFYDHQDKRRRRVKAKRGVYHRSIVAAAWTISKDVLRAEGLLNYRAWIWASYPGDESEGMEALKRLYWALHERRMPRDVLRRLFKIFSDAGNVSNAVLTRSFRRFWHRPRYKLENILEPDPSPQSRVTLSDTRDHLGVPRVRVDWRLGPLVKRTLARAHEIISEDLATSGLGRLEGAFRENDDRTWASQLRWTWHNMGTTRMDDSPERGVVDPNCRVHGSPNLFVGGSSVFPTAGNDMPTLTIVALALRLADHVKALLADAKLPWVAGSPAEKRDESGQ